ncbi:MAG: hypothetical protein AB7G75_36690 [Candidatus Binatia bacterium]
MPKSESTRGTGGPAKTAAKSAQAPVQKRREELLKRHERELLVRTRRRQVAESAEEETRELIIRCPKCGEALDHVVV